MQSVRSLANPEIQNLIPYEPGKPIEDVARELGLDPLSIIKLASNENPLGPSPRAIQAMQEALSKLHLYPDGGGFHLREGIAHQFGIQRENVILGNGSNEIIELLYHTFTRPGEHEVITVRNAFAVYHLMAQLFGVRCIEVPDQNYTHDLDAMLQAITPKTRLLFVANPNNPTGTRVSNEALDRFVNKLPDHVVLALDEAYYEFLDEPPASLNYIKEGRKVVLMRTFSKIQGLAGIRIGYGLAPSELADLLQRARQPFNTNSIAQAGALAGLQDLDHQHKTKEITDQGRTWMQNAFTQRQLEFVPSVANFILVKVGDAASVFKALLQKGIIVRSMVSYQMPEWIRVSIGTNEQNIAFLKALDAVLKKS